MRGRLRGSPQRNGRLKLVLGCAALVRTPPPPDLPGQDHSRSNKATHPAAQLIPVAFPVPHRGAPCHPGTRCCAKTPGTGKGAGQPTAGTGPGGPAARDPREGTGTHRGRGRQRRVVDARARSQQGAQPRRPRGPGLSPLPASRGLFCAPLCRGRVPRRRLCARSGSHGQVTPASRSAAAPATAAIVQPRLRPREGRSQSRRSPASAAYNSSPPGGLLCADSGGPASRPLGGSPLRRRGQRPFLGLLCAGSGSSRCPPPPARGSPLRRLGGSWDRRVSREWTPAGAVGRGWCSCGLCAGPAGGVAAAGACNPRGRFYVFVPSSLTPSPTPAGLCGGSRRFAEPFPSRRPPRPVQVRGDGWRGARVAPAARGRATLACSLRSPRPPRWPRTRSSSGPGARRGCSADPRPRPQAVGVNCFRRSVPSLRGP